MPEISDPRFQKIREIVCEILELEEDEVSADGLFKEDYGADSLRAIEILAALEKQFSIVIDQAELARMVNLRAVYEVIAETAGWNQEAATA